MEEKFWLDIWDKKNRCGFHQKNFNPYLVKYLPRLKAHRGESIFMPLAGKTRDILYCLDQGLNVIANELSPLAVLEFFQENHLTYQKISLEKFTLYKTERLQFYCGNFFDLSKKELADTSLIFDRAALIALPEKMREHYLTHMLSILPGKFQYLLSTIEYAPAAIEGPPFSVTEKEVRASFAKYRVEKLAYENQEILDGPFNGVKMASKVYLIEPSL